MFNDNFFTNAGRDIQNFFNEPDAFRSVIILVFSLIAAYFLSRFLTRGIVKIAQAVSTRSDNESNSERFLRLRQIETYLSVAVAVIRVVIVGIVGYIAWIILAQPKSGGTTAAAIGASAFVAVFAGQTLGMLLRDITAGAAMIVEKWFNVGDYIKIEPFGDVTGVVERMTLRSTRLRSLSGEVIWVHNQQIQAVHVTPNGVRTIAVDVFVSDVIKGEKAIKSIVNVIPTGPTMLASKLKIKTPEKWGDIWRITVTGQTMPGREWLIEKYFVGALATIDQDVKEADKIIVYDPIVRYADPTADRRFRRAVRVAKDK